MSNNTANYTIAVTGVTRQDYELHAVIENATQEQMEMLLDALMLARDMMLLQGNEGYSPLEEVADGQENG